MVSPHLSHRPRAAFFVAAVLSSAALSLVTAGEAAAAPGEAPNPRVTANDAPSEGVEVYQQPARVVGPNADPGGIAGPAVRTIAVAADTAPDADPAGAVILSALPDGEPCPAAGATLVITWVNIDTGVRGTSDVDACGADGALAETGVGQTVFSTRIEAPGHSPVGSSGSVGDANPSPYLSGNGAFEVSA
ncbi:hypothetical protein [Dietzia sp.]|uniref:hypothetical protein n=1 Tax=Dietzia sp. TaxID=1871616 RepID=UPI002FD87FC4